MSTTPPTETAWWQHAAILALLAVAGGYFFHQLNGAFVGEAQASSTTTLEERSEPTPPRPPPRRAAPPARAETVSARHILVQYSGSMRAPSTITRTQEEALERVQAALQQSQAGGDFAALARQYSDGPTGIRGGDLGAFARRRMHPAFEQAAFGLEVGGVSGVVETPFGYHIIQRYE